MANDVIWNDDEKVELIKKWWKHYGNWVVGAIVFVLIAIVAWQYWQRHEISRAATASATYEEMITSLEQQPKAAQDIAAQLKQNYSGTVYADYAAFTLTKMAIERKDYPEAETQLQWVIDNSNTQVNEQLARIRLARVLIADNKAQQAITVLNAKKIPIFPGLSALVEGDAYQALGKVDFARNAYKKAIDNLDKKAALWQLAQMKLKDLPASSAAATEQNDND